MNYLLTAIDPDLWKRVRMKALDEGMSVKEVILTLLLRWVEEKKE